MSRLSDAAKFTTEMTSRNCTERTCVRRNCDGKWHMDMDNHRWGEGYDKEEGS